MKAEKKTKIKTKRSLETSLQRHLNNVSWPPVYLSLVKANWWSIVNAAFCLVELLLGYMLYSPLVAKSAGFENQNNGD